MNIAFFDFDGTVTSKVSLAEFIKFAVGKRRFYLGILATSPTLIAYKLKLLSNHAAKQIFFSHFFKNWASDHFHAIASEYSVNHLDEIIRKNAIEKMNWHKDNGDRVIVVSASIENWLAGWCDKNNVGLIATQIQESDHKITGNFSTKNCYGMEKVNRIRQTVNLADYDEVYAYGDSAGDKEMLQLADKSYYKKFN